MKRILGICGPLLCALALSGTASAATYSIAPVNAKAPSVSGTPAVGDTLTATSGQWLTSVGGSDTGSSYTYQWQSAPSNESTDWTDIPGATSTTYYLTTSDQGLSIRVAVTDTCTSACDLSTPGSSATADSGPSAPIAVSAPINLTAPKVTGTVALGHALHASEGSWSPSGTPYFEWQRMTRAGWVSISGAGTNGFYRVRHADVGHQLRVEMSETNTTGTGIVYSAPTAAAVGRPRVLAVPVLRGGRRVGDRLRLTVGRYAHGRAVSFRVYACAKDCHAIGAAHRPGAAVRLTADELDKSVTVKVAVRGPGGTIRIWVKDRIGPVLPKPAHGSR